MDRKKAHVYVTLYGNNGQKLRVKSLVDTGNTIHEETAVTEAIHNKLNVGLEEIGGLPIGTANKDAPKMQKLGTSNLIQMEIEGIKGRFQIKPAVVPTLTDGLNIGNGFLTSLSKQVPVKLEFDGGNARLKVGRSQTELMRQMTDPIQKGQEQVDRSDPGNGQKSLRSQCHTEKKPSVEEGRQGSREQSKKTGEGSKRRPREHGPTRRQQVFAKDEVVCSANSVTFVEIITERPLSEGIEVLIEHDEQNQMETVQAMYKWKKKNHIAVVNHASVGCKILKNSSLGFIAKAEVDKKEDEKQTQSYLEKIHSITDDHRMEIVNDLNILQNPVLKANPEIQKKAVRLVMEFADIFGEKGKSEVGVTDLVEFEIELKPGTRPVKQKVRTLNPHQKASLEAQMDTWRREGMIEDNMKCFGSGVSISSGDDDSFTCR